jgi:glycine/D-amino acid oxidase-like deaminating enzyme
VVIVGGGIIGASVAWHLTARPGFAGRVLVIERDPSYATASTSHSNSCIRQQFSTEINVKISRYAAEVIRDFPKACADTSAPQIRLQAFGYLYLAGSAPAAANLRTAQALQAALGARTRLLAPAEIAEAWPFYALDGVHLGSHGPVDEGYFDGAAMFDHWRRASRRRGVTWMTGEVTGLTARGGRVSGGRLASGETFGCGWLVNAAGPRAARLAAMAGIALPVEPRKRFTWVFAAERPLPVDLPLTIDPSGVHVRTDGALYMAGCAPRDDGPVDPADFDLDPEIWDDHVWPALAARIPAFEAIRVRRAWAGHYAYNTLDQNAVVGPHDGLPNFLFANGFSGHGLQQAPAMGRGLAEWIAEGRWVTLDLADLGWSRIAQGRPLRELAVI